MATPPEQPDAAVTWQPRRPAADEPACWSWSVPPVRDLDTELPLLAARSREEAAAGDPDDWVDISTLRLGYYKPEILRWQEFHSGVRMADVTQAPQRCALCGVVARWPDLRLVDDHCHDTGQVRGQLCKLCNTREGRSSAPIYERYRRVHPAAILDAHEMYTGFHWRDGWNLREPGPAGRRPPTPWPPLPASGPLAAGSGGPAGADEGG